MLVRSGLGLSALMAIGLSLASTRAHATPPSDTPVDTEAELALDQPPELAAPQLGAVGLAGLAGEVPALALHARVPALPSTPALLGAPVVAKRARDRSFDTSMGEVDPRKRKLPRTHRFRLAIHSQYVRLTRTLDPTTDEYVRFHFAPLMLDVAYQAQFLKYAMVRLAVAAGGNIANSRNAMPGVLFPQAYVGVQTRVLGLAFGYGYDWAIPPTIGATDGSPSALQQPAMQRNHVVMGEVSATSRIDRVALTFSLTLGGVKSLLTHYDTVTNRFRFYLGLQAGVFFDGTIRREKKARKRVTGR